MHDHDDDDDEVSIHAKHVNYKLNENKAIHKKIGSCDRVTHTFELHDSYFIGVFNTAAFELFRNDLMKYIKKCKQYVYQLSEMRELSGKVTQDTIYVKENSCSGTTDIRFDDLPKFYTITIYRTKDKIMVNGPGFRRFVDHDLPVMTGNIENVKDILSNANGQIKKSLLTQEMTSGEDGGISLNKISYEISNVDKDNEDDECPGPVESVDSKRNRKKKTYDGYEMNMNLSKTSVSCKLSIDASSVKDKKWNAKPKYWDKYGNGEWTDEVAKQCNKRKGCLKQCGKNNSSEMICCDGCGKWCHFKCSNVPEFEEADDYICYICNEKVAHESVPDKSESFSIVGKGSEDIGVISEEVVDLSVEKISTHDVKIPDVNEVTSIETTNEDDCFNSVVAVSSEATAPQNDIITKPLLDSCDIESYISEMVDWYNETNKQTIGEDHKYLHCELLQAGNKATVSYYNGGQGNVESTELNVIDNVLRVTGENLDKQEACTKYKERGSQLLNMIRGTENENLYTVIMKQKDKISDLKMQLAEPNLPRIVINHITFLATALVEKEIRVREFDMKNKDAKVQIAELKRTKKRYEEQLSCKDIENEKAKSSVSILKKQVEDLRSEEQKLRKEIIEIRTGNSFTDLVTENADLNMKLEKLAKENSAIKKNEQELEAKLEVLKIAQNDIKSSSELENLQNVNSKLTKKLNDLIKENTVLKDRLQEEKSKYENVDNFYASIIENKDKTISKYLEISAMPHDPENKLRRLLSYHKAEKEMQAMTRLSESLLENDGKMEGGDKEVQGKEKPKIEVSPEVVLSENNTVTLNDKKMEPDAKLMEFIKSRNGDEHQEQLSSNKKVCWFGPMCFRSTCEFEHGTCMSPPNCRFNMKCTRRDCIFTHPDDCTARVGCTVVGCTKRHIVGAQMKVDDTGSRSKVDKRESVVCHYGLACNRNGCVFKHANDCLTRRNCQITECENRHIDQTDKEGNKNEMGEARCNDEDNKHSSNQVHCNEANSCEYPVRNTDGMRDGSKCSGMYEMRYHPMNLGFNSNQQFCFPNPNMLNWMNVPGMFSKNAMCR